MNKIEKRIAYPTIKFKIDEGVELKLKIGQSIHHFKSEPTDEGWSSITKDWSFDGRNISYTILYEGADCDGVHSQYVELTCKVEDIESHVSSNGSRWPLWVKVDQEIRDYSAEKAGY